MAHERSSVVSNASAAAAISVAFCFAALFAYPMSAEDCNAILEHGIFDTNQTNSSAEHTRAFLNWLSQSTFSSYKEARDTGLKIGFEIDNIPIELGGYNREDNWHQYQAQLQTLSAGSESSFYQFASAVKQADANIVNAWKSCTENAKGVVHAFAEQNYDPGRFVLRIIYDPVGRPNSANITSFSVQPSSVHCDPAIYTYWFWHTSVDSKSLILNCTRKPADSVQITGNTEKGPLSAKLPGIVAAAPPKAAQANRAPHHNNPLLSFAVAFSDKKGAEPYPSGAWTRFHGIETIALKFEEQYPDLEFAYMCHEAGKGDSHLIQGPGVCGEQEKGLSLEGFSINLTGPSGQIL